VLFWRRPYVQHKQDFSTLMQTLTYEKFLSEQRLRLYSWLRSCLMGPVDGSPLIGLKPLDRYQIGILYPIVKGFLGVDPASEDDGEEEEDLSDDEPQDDEENRITAKPVAKKRRYTPPSSVGFSFFIRGSDVRLQIVPQAVFYKESWKRKSFSENDVLLPDFHSPAIRSIHTQTKRVFNDLAEVLVLWRPVFDGWLATVSLSNRQEMPEDCEQEKYRNFRNKLSFFEVQLECIVESGEIGDYPRIDPALLNEEDQELELQYRHKRIFAVGHGAAVDWEEKNGRVHRIWSEFLPKVEVPQVSVDAAGSDDKVLFLEYLSRFAENSQEMSPELESFVNTYETWIDGQCKTAEKLPENEKLIAGRIISRMKAAAARMRQGIDLLRQDTIAARSFGLANEAMYRQMKQYDLARGMAEKPYRWRPFQLGFLLMVIESVVHEDSDFRDTLDLIWFPTGGGKTEAYFGLIAFLIFWRRIRFPASGGGTSVLMRYTLRLLTRQQFQRASRLICAMELMRREKSDLGREPISIGMWVGEVTSPNTFDVAKKLIAKAMDDKDASLEKLILDSCPWCQNPFKAPDSFIVSANRFHFKCTNPACDFGKSGADGVVPCNVVDEALYASPPSLMIATIDKFARLAWEERTGSFFGLNGNRPPELVIQDELHLIAGALGSVAGLYEAALDVVLQHRGVFPKYIASTATIRMAEQQVRRLYGRPMAVFPPPGLSSDDSFFARTVPTEEKPGRLYLGYLAHDKKRQDSLPPLAAALIVAPEHLYDNQIENDLLLDAWWTIVIFHGSLMGVGLSHNALDIDTSDFFQHYLNRKTIAKSSRHKIFFDRIAQLTSITSPEENAATFARLENRYDHPECLDVVLATNMISVGLDVSRLGLMVVKGQPLTTAEYIQASSRVGRGDVPGIVIINYYRDQARSLSHYESFRPYHESFYRFVEPTSLTPYTYQARIRAMHAALVIAVRHCCSGLKENQCAGNFDPNSSAVKKVLELLTFRFRRTNPEQIADVENHLHVLVDQWKNHAQRCHEERRRLDYQAPDNNNATDRLIFNHDDRIKGLWATLQSMRNVESTGLLELK
jgi:hypothetical protein